MEHRVGGGDGVWWNQRKFCTEAAGGREADPADPGDPQGWIKHCWVMGWQWEEGHLSYHLWPLGPATLSTGTLPVCSASQCVKQNGVMEAGVLSTSRYPWPSVSLSIKMTGSLYGTQTRWIKLVSVWGSCVLHQAAASDQPAKLGLGVLLILRTKRQSARHCAVLCRPMDCNPLGSSVHEGREGVCTAGTRCEGRPGDLMAVSTCRLGGWEENKSSNLHVYLMPRTLKI